MDYAEATAWYRRASPASAMAVMEADTNAVRHWLDRVCTDTELRDLSPFCAAPLLFPAIVAEAAGQAAQELAIVCAIWPNKLDAVLRPQRRAPKSV